MVMSRGDGGAILMIIVIIITTIIDTNSDVLIKIRTPAVLQDVII